MNMKAKHRSAASTTIPFGDSGFQRLHLQSVLNALNRIAEKRPRVLDGSRWEWQEINVRGRQLELRHLVALWDAANRNLLTLFRRFPELGRACSHGTTWLIPNRDGAAQLAWTPALKGHISTPQKAEALKFFIELLVNPLAKELGGPCKRCGLYF
jgi:hypothetical protein